MISYNAFGLRISASSPIPMLLPLTNEQAEVFDLAVVVGERPDINNINEEGVVRFPPNGGTNTFYNRQILWYPQSGFTLVRYPDGTDFYIDSESRTIWASWLEPWAIEDMATYLLGPIIGYVLRRLGRLVLHASSFTVNGRAIAILGSAGAGKSTTAAAFAQRNLPILADDVTALEERGSLFWAAPSYGHLRLWPESSEIIYGSRDALPLISPNWDKLDVDLGGLNRFCKESKPLGLIYWLAPRSEHEQAPYIEPLNATDQLMKLVENSYGNVLLDCKQRETEFLTIGRLLRTVSVRKVVPHCSADRLPQLLDLVLHDSAKFLD